MKRIISVMLVLVMSVLVFAGCSSDNKGEDKKSDTVNLMDMYSVKDPEGVEYDERHALYMPVLESDTDSYNLGMRHMFCVFYGKDGKGVYMYDIQIFETEEQAAAYAEEAEATVDGKVCISESDSTMFAVMEAFIPDLATWINNLKASGMTDID